MSENTANIAKRAAHQAFNSTGDDTDEDEGPGVTPVENSHDATKPAPVPLHVDNRTMKPAPVSDPAPASKPPPVSLRADKRTGKYLNKYYVFRAMNPPPASQQCQNVTSLSLANAVFNGVPVCGKSVLYPGKTKLNENFRFSVQDCIKTIRNRLRLYGIEATHLTTHAGLTALRSVMGEDFAQGHASADMASGNRTIKLYCRRCLNCTPDPEEVNLAVVAEIFITCCDETPTTKHAQAQVARIFPHDMHCTSKVELTPSAWLNWDVLGSGRVAVPIPSEEIFRDVYVTILNKMTRNTVDNPPPGEKISNGAGLDGLQPYEHDERFFQVIPSTDPYYKAVEWKGHCEVIERLFLWFSCTFNAARQFMNESGPIKHTHGNKQGVSYYPNIPFPDTVVVPDKFLQKPAFLFGGHQHKNVPDASVRINQPAHHDIGAIQLKGTKGPVSVSQNPALWQKLKPGTLIVALQDHREIFFLQDGYERCYSLQKNMCLYFAGDVSHGGVTYYRIEEPFGWHCAFQIYVMSDFHPKDTELFDLDPEGILKLNPTHVSLFDPAKKLETFDDASATLKIVLKAALDDEQGNEVVKARATAFGEEVLQMVKDARSAPKKRPTKKRQRK